MGNRFKSLGSAPPSPQMRPQVQGMQQGRPMQGMPSQAQGLPRAYGMQQGRPMQPGPQVQGVQQPRPMQGQFAPQNFDQMLFRPGVKPVAPQPRGGSQLDEIVMQLLRSRGR